MTVKFTVEIDDATIAAFMGKVGSSSLAWRIVRAILLNVLKGAVA
jgi:hypothetical protein